MNIKYRLSRPYYMFINIIYSMVKGLPVIGCFTCDMRYSNLPASTYIPHPFAIVISEHVKIGERCMICQCSTLGSRLDGTFGAPIVGNDVIIGAGALVLGPVFVGDNAQIGASSIVLRDVPAGATVKGVWK